jgi:hypothetical protein
MGGMQGIKINVNRQSPRAADPGNQNDFVLRVADVINGSDERA